MTEALTAEQAAILEKPYKAISDATEWWCGISVGPFAFRFGPYESKRIGEIITQSVKESISIFVVGNCGTEFDWELTRDAAPRLLPKKRFARWAMRLRILFGKKK